MTAFTSTNPAARIGKLKGDILKHAMPAEVLGITGQQRMMPKNQSKSVAIRGERGSYNGGCESAPRRRECSYPG